MLRRLEKAFRVRAAIALAVLYGFCVIAPSVALAFVDKTVAAHCFTDDHDGVGVTHVHTDGMKHSHDDTPLGKTDDHDKDKTDHCCGLFSITAGAIAPLLVLAEPDQTTVLRVVLDDVVGGCRADRIDRPPRSHPSL